MAMGHRYLMAISQEHDISMDQAFSCKKIPRAVMRMFYRRIKLTAKQADTTHITRLTSLALPVHTLIST